LDQLIEIGVDLIDILTRFVDPDDDGEWFVCGDFCYE
jgi:hypothetical protein